MCGIFGYIGRTNAIGKVLDGLSKLEYRGYDSAGLAYIKDKKLKTIKSVGKVDLLKEKSLSLLNEDIKMSLAHTRWATHGRATELNCHPHTSGDFALVHNGIIENYQILKDNIIKNEKAKFYSDTDSEVIVKLLDINFKKINKKIKKNREKIKKIEEISENILKSIENTSQQLKGAWAVAVINKNIPNKIFVFKKGSPLVVANNGQESYVSSDINAIENDEKLPFNYYSMQEDNIAEISSEKVVFYDKNLKKIKLNKNKKEQEINLDNKKYKHNMLKEICEIPQAINLTEKSIKNIKNNKFIKKIKKCSHITFVGCGTAYNAGLYGKYIFEKLLKKSTEVELASEFRYKEQLYSKREVVIAVSQSGETADTIAALKIAKQNGATTIVITNVAGSNITKIADFVFLTNAGKEIAVAATKSYVTQIFVLYELACLVIGKTTRNILGRGLVDIVEKYKENENFKKYFEINKFFFIGRLCDAGTAAEGALKLKEIAYVHSEGYPAGELKHGTLSLIDENALVIAIITQSNIKEKTLNAVHEVKARGANVLIISQFSDLAQEGDFIELPQIDEELLPILSVIPLQLLAYHYSVNKELDPDMPRNLAKSVTVE